MAVLCSAAGGLHPDPTQDVAQAVFLHVNRDRECDADYRYVLCMGDGYQQLPSCHQVTVIPCQTEREILQQLVTLVRR